MGMRPGPRPPASSTAHDRWNIRWPSYVRHCAPCRSRAAFSFCCLRCCPGASELGGGQLRRRTEPGAPRRSPAGLVASMARRCAPVHLGRPLVRVLVTFSWLERAPGARGRRRRAARALSGIMQLKKVIVHAGSLVRRTNRGKPHRPTEADF